MSLHDVRDFYARLVTAEGGSSDERLARAFATVDRTAFAGDGPWKVFTANGYVDTPSDDPAFVYQDVVIALKPERGINNGEPALHARCIAAVAPQAGESVIHVGAGSGYYTAILAELVGLSGCEASRTNADSGMLRPRASLLVPGRRTELGILRTAKRKSHEGDRVVETMGQHLGKESMAAQDEQDSKQN